MNKSHAITVALVLILGTTLCGNAQAWWPYWGCGCGSDYGGPSYGLSSVPHFALYPPVYYSYPEPRTYGYSPFASPPEAAVAEETAPVEPLLVRNPYVPQSVSSAADETPAANQPLVVQNPYVAHPSAGNSPREERSLASATPVARVRNPFVAMPR